MVDRAGPKMTIATQMVLRAFLEQPTQQMYGLQICQVAGLPSGTIHPILARLERLGWLDSQWEEVDSHKAGRPRRRYYRLSPDGAQEARNALTRARTSVVDLSGLRLGPVYGGGAA